MIQKVIKVGSSAAITIPKDYLRKLGLSIGQQVETKVDGNQLQARPIEPNSKVDSDLVAWADKFTTKYRDTLVELKNR